MSQQEPEADDVPPLVWTRVGGTGRGRAPTLTHADIARVAVEVADAEGLDAVTMRRLATELAVGTMSLYRYVAGRDDVLDLMIDAVAAGLSMDGVPDGDWRAVLRRVGHNSRTMVLDHPWLAQQALGTRPALGPNTLRWLERTMQALDDPTLSIDQLLDLTGTVTSFVIGYGQVELAERGERQRTGMTEQQWRARLSPYVQSVIDTGEFPMLKRIIVDAEDFPDPNVVFERRLGYVIEGLGVELGLT